jgi:hypothetical protein
MSETSGEQPVTGTSNFDSLQIDAKTARYVFDGELALRFGKQVHGGAGYCLDDVFPEKVAPAGAMAAEAQAAKTRLAMINNPGHEAWQKWKVRLWNLCAFGLAIGAEAGTAFLIGRRTANPSGDRYQPLPQDARLWQFWKTLPGVTTTFVKVNMVPEGTVALDTITYDPSALDERAIDALYGTVLQKLSELAGEK